ncbi:MAG: septum formation initiator family protein [Sphingomonadales bacterium]|nr:septum formation initiator family protein [Sphingomonadales bacterium]
MRVITPLKHRLNRALGPTLALAACFYFGYHTVHGNYGLLALKRLDREIAEIAPQARALAEERAALEARVALMDPKAMDRDRLDQAAREMLGFVHAQDVVIFIDH